MPDSRFSIGDTPLAGLKLVERRRISDDRGFLSRFYCRDELVAAGFTAPIVQINQTLTRKRGTVRGMHYQNAPHAEDKFVSVVRGEVFDVAVDLRRGSPTFRQWHGAILSADNAHSLFIPRGFAHGFQTLSDDCELIYLHTQAYHAAAEGAVSPLDPSVAIDWPEGITDMSDRDRHHPLLENDFTGISV